MGLQAAVSPGPREDREAETPGGASASPLSLSPGPAASTTTTSPPGWIGALPRGPTMVGSQRKQAVHQLSNTLESLRSDGAPASSRGPNSDTRVRGENQRCQEPGDGAH